ncbi:MAG: protein kinase [Planctomycetes bacterium]|nr:protein kinase [Planctomycetota bacterium]
MEQEPAAAAPTPTRIVLVEDSEVVRRFAQQLLVRKGFHVVEFPDGAAALDQVLRDPPALVISDIQMPHMDGLELTRRLRERYDKRRLPVVLVSVLSEEENIVAGFEAGANDYLIKPYRTAELMAKVSVLLREGEFLRRETEPTLPPEEEAPAAPAATAAAEAPPPAPPSELPSDETAVRGFLPQASPHYFFDQYVVTGEYGRGGMGTVYRAMRRDDQTPVALKVLAPRLSENRTAIARFLREIRVLSSLETEHVVRVLDHGYDAGRYFLVMEAVEGDALDRIVLRDGPLPEAETARIFWQVCRALQDLADQGLVHRDVKPANVIRRASDGLVKLVDFGLAKYEHEASTLTETGYALGTSYYVAPEVIEGAKADPRSDLFAVGVSMFETLTGRRPFPGVVPYQIFKRIVSGPTPDATQFRAGLSPGLLRVLGRLLERDPAARYQRGEEVERDLKAWLESDEGQAAESAAPAAVADEPRPDDTRM